MTFLRMQTICLHIPQIVEAIDAARNQTERDKHHQCGPEEFWLQQVIAEEYRCKDKDVLQPLQRTEQSNIMNHCCKDSVKFRFSEENANLFASLSVRNLSKSSEMPLYKRLEVSEGKSSTLTRLSLSPHAEVFRGITL